MRYLITFVVLACVVAAFSRPSDLNDDQEDNEYDNEEEAPVDDSLHEDDGPRVNNQEPTYAEQEEEDIQKSMNEEKRNVPSPSEHQSRNDKCDNSPDYKMNNGRESEDMKPQESYQPQSLQQHNRYIEVKDENEQTALSENMPNIAKEEKLARRAVSNRRSAKTTVNDSGDELFENAISKERIYKNNNNQRPDVDASNEPDHEAFFKNYYKSLQAAERNYENIPPNVYRDRRQAQDAGSAVSSVNSIIKDNSKNTIYENEENAIKRHIKKLSEQELQSLLNSLPEEKRTLLNKIIDNDKNHYDGVSKRDITKKAGAVEENIDNENSVFDSNKVHGSSEDIKNDVGCNTETTENVKTTEYHTEMSEMSSPKKTSSEELVHDKDSAFVNEAEKSTVNLNDSNNKESKSQVESNIQPSKLNSKRETSLNYVDNECSKFKDIKSVNTDLNPIDASENLNEETGFNYQNEDLTQFMGSDVLLDNNVIEHANKREALLENTDSFKSLEDSFPNSNTYKESGEYSEIDMVPLVRVKRRNDGTFIKKRSAQIIPNDRAAYIPRAENDDDDSEEGNEFEDDGLYDRSSNYAKNNFVDVSGKKIHNEKKEQADISREENIESDTMNIGSDSDSVLSGVEGVDDNLMYNSGTRNKRTFEMNTLGQDTELSSIVNVEPKTPSDNLNAANYQENDSFGPLPRNYEGELNRLKRIRRVKPPCNDVSSSDKTK